MRKPQTSIFLAFVFTVLFGTPAYAVGDRPTVPLGGGFDVNLLFEDDGKPMELAMLTPQEMADTEAAFTWAAFRQIFVFSGSALKSLFDKVKRWRAKAELHTHHTHNFVGRWEKLHLDGPRFHFQVDAWRDGVKGSRRSVHIPVGRRRWHEHRREWTRAQRRAADLERAARERVRRTQREIRRRGGTPRSG